MLPTEFSYLQNLIKSRSGIDLREDKLYLFESRLLPIAAQHGHKSLSSFVAWMMQSLPTEALLQQMIEAMTTNESMFFRDTKPFHYLKDIALKELLARKPNRPISMWCAACSSGQEPYSLAMLAQENKAMLAGAPVSILATDIDQQILSKARAGVYNQFEVQRGLPMPLLLKYFSQLPENRWQLQESIRGGVTFKQHNLMNNARHHGSFDVVFCRYVLIYFDDTTKNLVLSHIADTMPRGGYLFLGSAETLPVGTALFAPHPQERSIYVRV
jgi:chemotaxis protein methyltransferase CheR